MVGSGDEGSNKGIWADVALARFPCASPGLDAIPWEGNEGGGGG